MNAYRSCQRAATIQAHKDIGFNEGACSTAPDFMVGERHRTAQQCQAWASRTLTIHATAAPTLMRRNQRSILRQIACPRRFPGVETGRRYSLEPPNAAKKRSASSTQPRPSEGNDRPLYNRLLRSPFPDSILRMQIIGQPVQAACAR